MKKFKMIAVLAIAFCFLLGTTAVYAAGEDETPSYIHQLTVSAGNGDFDTAAKKGTSATIDRLAGKVEVKAKDGSTVSTSTLDTLPDGKDLKNSKYFVTGMKLAGYDNYEGDNYVFTNTVDIYGATALPSYKEKDTELVVAYGLKGNMVEYTVSYVDAQSGAELHPSEKYYGEIGQSPVESFKHVAGYLPDAYMATLTLNEDPALNIIEFKYSPVQAAEGQTIVNNAGNAGGGNAAGNAAGGNAGANAGGNAAAAPGTAIGDADTPLALNDQDTPLAANPDEEEGGGPGAFPFIIGGVIAAAIIAAIAAVLARRRSEEEAE